MASRLSGILSDLKRRKVFHVAAAYVVVAAILAGAANDFLPGLGAPEWTVGFIIVLILIGFPIALVLAWAYELKPEERVHPDPSSTVPLLKDQGTATSTTRTEEYHRSIVVLPFDNMSPDPVDAYFSDGLTEEIITNLSHIKTLRVISRSSAIVLKQSGKDIRTIGEELDVGYVLEGSVRKAGDRLRISAQLIDAGNDAHLWAEKYDGVLGDVFTIQEQVSRSIAGALDLALSGQEQERLRNKDFQDPRAFECYLKARHDLHLSTQESFKRATRRLEDGLRIWIDNPVLTATLGEAYWYSVDFGYETDPSYLDRISELANRALEIDPTSAHGRKLLAALEKTRGNVAEATRLISEALKIAPHDTGILTFAATFLSWFAGKDAESMKLFGQLLAIDPLSPNNYLYLGFSHMEGGRYEKGLDSILKAKEMGLEFPWTGLWIGYTKVALGKTSEAIEELERVVEEGAPEPGLSLTRFLLAGLKGDSDRAMVELGKGARQWAWESAQITMLMPGLLAYIGETDSALGWLDHSLDQGTLNYPFFALHDYFLRGLRDDPRFMQRMAELKPKWDASGF